MRNIESQLLPAKAAAAWTGIAYTTLRDLVIRGELPVVKFGRGSRRAAWYFRREDLQRLIDSHTEASRENVP